MMIQETLQTPITENCDVLVCGGGFAGISAALAAARQGKEVEVEARTIEIYDTKLVEFNKEEVVANVMEFFKESLCLTGNEVCKSNDFNIGAFLICLNVSFCNPACTDNTNLKLSV